MTEIIADIADVRRLLDSVYHKTGGLICKQPDFNLITLFFREHYEVKLHSRFIAELLNPQGRHGFGDAFLEAWLKRMEINDKFSRENAIVRTEIWKIDIWVRNSRNQHIIIENKIYADDQDMQLPRYAKKIQEMYSAAKEDIFIVYLTLDGRELPEEHITELKKMGFDAEDCRYSYSVDVLEWINDCIGIAAQKPTLRESLVMYLEIVKYLTNQTGDRKMKETVKKEILKRPASFRAALAINDALIDAKIELQYKFWQMLEKEMREQLKPLGLEWKKKENSPRRWSDLKNIQNYYRGSRNQYYYGQETELGKWDESTQLFFRVELGRVWEGKDLYYGIIARKIGDKNETDDKYNNTHERFKDLIELAQKISIKSLTNNQWWIASAYTNPQLNWEKFDSEDIFRLTDEEDAKKLISEMAKEMSDFIKSFQAQLNSLPRKQS